MTAGSVQAPVGLGVPLQAAAAALRAPLQSQSQSRRGSQAHSQSAHGFLTFVYTQAPVGLGVPLQAAAALLAKAKAAEATRPDVRAQAALGQGSGASTGPPAEPKKFLGMETFTWIKITALGFMFFCIL